MKKMRFYLVLVSIITCGAITFASCEKTEDVNFSDAQTPTVIEYPKTVDGGVVPCPFCQWDIMHGMTTATCDNTLTENATCDAAHNSLHMIQPDGSCRHLYHKEQACPYGQYCSHVGQCHYHVFWNWYHDNNTHTEQTTHCGGTVNSHGHATH